MSLRLQWKASQDALHLLSGDLLDFYRWSLSPGAGSSTFYPNIYFSYNVMTQQTTIVTTDMVLPHLFMIQHLEKLSGMSIQPGEIARLLTQCFDVIQECFRAIAQYWDENANGPVSGGKRHYTCAKWAYLLNRLWHHELWTTVRTMTLLFGLLNRMPELQI